MEVLEGTVRRLSSLERIDEIVVGGREWGYRQRARLHATSCPSPDLPVPPKPDAKADEGGAAPARCIPSGRTGDGSRISIGFFSQGTHDIVPIEGCPVCVPPLDQAIASLSRMESPFAFSSTVELVADDEGKVLAAFFLSEPCSAPQRFAEYIGAHTTLSGVLVVSPGKARGVWGMSHSFVTVSDDPPSRVPVHAAAFCQANAEVNRMLVQHVVSSITTNPPSHAAPCVLELYAGHGNITYPLAARGAQVTAVEIGVDRSILPPTDGVKFMRKDALDALRSFRSKKGGFDTVLLDPPRTGAKQAMPLVTGLEPKRIVYVSCDPNTFARDAEILQDLGYSLTRLTPFDMVPQTHHVELVGVFAG